MLPVVVVLSSTLRSWIMDFDLPTQVDMGCTLHGEAYMREGCFIHFLYAPYQYTRFCQFTCMHTCTHTHTQTHSYTHTHLIVDSIRCVLVRCPLQNTRVPCLTDLLQGCKVVIKSNTAVFTGGARTLLICAQWANCTDRQTDRQEVPEGNSYMAVNSSCI